MSRKNVFKQPESQWAEGNILSMSPILGITFTVWSCKCIWLIPEAHVCVMHLTILLPVNVIISPCAVHSWCLTCLTISACCKTYSPLPESSRQPFNRNDASLLARKKKGHAICMQQEIPSRLPQTWHAPCPLSSPFIFSNCSHVDLSTIDGINWSIESEQHGRFKLSMHTPMWPACSFCLFIVFISKCCKYYRQKPVN